jgi:hypothetical protein
MKTKVTLAVVMCLTAAARISASVAIEGVVLEVTTDAITVKGPTDTVKYKVSNELLTNSVSDHNLHDLKGKFREVKKGCKILMEYEGQGGELVCVGLEVRK